MSLGTDGESCMWSPGFGSVAHQRACTAGNLGQTFNLHDGDNLWFILVSWAWTFFKCFLKQVCKVFSSYAEGNSLKVVMLAGQKSFAAEQASLSENR